MNTHRVIIRKCSDPLMWYRDEIGRSFPLEGQCHEGYLTREPAGYINIVRFADGDVVKEESTV